MFKKLKDKITEEVRQSPLKFPASVQQLTQAVAPSIPASASDDHFVISENDAGVSHNEKPKSKSETKDDDGMATLSLSRRSSLSSVTNDLFPIYESPGVFNQFQSDLESNASEVEDLFTSYQLDQVSKDKLYTACRKMQARYQKYKGRYSDLVRHYKKLEQENQKAKSILSETQDKALRRIAELKEQCQLEQKAKAHLEEALRNDIEERDHLINTLNTKIGYLRDGSESGIDMESLGKTNESSEDLPSRSPDGSSERTPVSTSADAALKEKMKKLEELLQKSKGVITEKINTIKDLNKENEELKSEMKELATAKEEVISLRKVVETLQKREEEIALSMAESKRSIFLELESKETQIKDLKETLANTLQEKAQLSDKVANLEASAASKLFKVQKELESLKEKNSLMEEELRSKEVEIITAKKSVVNLTQNVDKELSLKETEVKALKESLSEAQNELNMLKRSCASKPSDSDGHGAQSGKLEAVKDIINATQEESSASSSPNEKESVIELKNIVELLQKELVEKENKLRHINEHSVNNSTKLNLSIEKVNQMENDFRSKREEWMLMKAQYQKQIDEHLSKIQKLKESIDDLNQQINQKDGKITNCESVIISLEERLATMKGDLDSKTQDNDGFKKEIYNLKNQLTKYTSDSRKTDELEKNFASITLKLEEKNLEQCKILQDLETKSIESKNLFDENLILQEEVDLLNKNVKEKDSSLIELKNALAKMEGDFKEQTSSLRMHSNELLSKLNDLESIVASKNEEIDHHKNLVTNLEQSVADLKGQLECSSNESQVKLLQSEIVELKKENEESSKKLEEFETRLEEVSAKLKDSESKLQKAEQIKSNLEDSLKGKNEEYKEYINNHNEFLKIKNILQENHLLVKTSVSELIANLVEINHSASRDKDALEKLKLEQEVLKKNEEKWRGSFIQSLTAVRRAKEDIFCLKQDLAKIFIVTKTECANVLNDCLNYSTKFVEEKKRAFDSAVQDFEHRETELQSIQSQLSERVKGIKDSLSYKNSIIEAQEKQIAELTSKAHISETLASDYSESIKQLQNQLSEKDEIKNVFNERECEETQVKENYLLQVSGKESDSEELKSKFPESQEHLSETMSVKDLEKENKLLKIKLKRYEQYGDECQIEKPIEKCISKEVQCSKQDCKNPKNECEDLSLAEIENLEWKHQQEIHEIEKRYAALLAEKYKEYEILEAKYHEQEINQERRLNKEVREILKDAKGTEELQNEQLEEFRAQLKQTEEEASMKVQQLKQEHLVEINATIKKWKNFLEKKIAELERKHSDELIALTKEWHQERKIDFENIPSPNAVFENQELEALSNSVGTDVERAQSLSLQLNLLKKELNEEKNIHRLEVQELQKLLSKKKSSRRSKEQMEQDLEDCTEMEYLRNILYEYMMGKEPVVLARVLAAIVKFDSEQTSRVIQKEEQRYSLLGQLGIS